MLDVHSPEHTPHSWRDFFIHIATIVVGLLIAVALEQTVEFFHHRHQRIELEESLQADTEKSIEDAKVQREDVSSAMGWLDTRIGQIQDALDQNRPLAAPSSEWKFLEQVLPDDPAWKAARSSGLIEVLPQNEIKVYSEIDTVVESLLQLIPPSEAVLRQRAQFEWKFQHKGSKEPDFSHASRQDLNEYLNIMLAIKANTTAAYSICGELLHGELVLLHGAKDLNSVQNAERTGM